MSTDRWQFVSTIECRHLISGLQIIKYWKTSLTKTLIWRSLYKLGLKFYSLLLSQLSLLFFVWAIISPDKHQGFCSNLSPGFFSCRFTLHVLMFFVTANWRWKKNNNKNVQRVLVLNLVDISKDFLILFPCYWESVKQGLIQNLFVTFE